ncbi:MAG: hypothetical protein OEO21_08930 [Candidatus Krumholzibacteria bacterium]|nr:hypothetical protein [Candidatus Krumholzibacteria bacterium]
MRHAALVLGGALLAAATPLVGQQRPRLEVDLRASDPDPPEAVISLKDLLTEDRFLSAIRSGFPLYLAYTVELRESRPLWDRDVERWVWEYVVLYDPVRGSYVLEDPDGTEEIPDRSVLERKLGLVYVVPLRPDRPGRYHYRATVTARTLTDEDVDEVYAWLRGDDIDAARRNRPGFVTRAARRLLVQVAPLPRLTLEGRTAGFTVAR